MNPRSWDDLPDVDHSFQYCVELADILLPEKSDAARPSRDQIPAPTRPCPSACEVCGAQPEKKALCLDHEHLTNTFRGWLCHRCNRLLGFAKDSPVLLRALAAYLERSL